ncbi:rhodanese-like domain-containing protein [Hymenobacter sp. 102]|uniref:rhodanese-like domain-containing protein n=1 Tax=Hymenobacter sp. 102 TaxID=3403152 RepID=UPI003CF33C72
MLRYSLTLAFAVASLSAMAQTNVVQDAKLASPLPKNVALRGETAVVAAPAVTKIPPQKAKVLLQQPGTVLLDVRTPEEFAAGHLAGAENLNFNSPDFASRLASLDPNKVYVLYCRSGNRSNQAGLVMQDKGFKKVLNAGGYEELKKQDVKK